MIVALAGYRGWALEIFDRLVKETGFIFANIDEADVVLYYGWSWKIKPDIYKKKLCLILHPSPLPKYRGGSPLQHQIINGEKQSAVTILQVTDKLDAGDIYSQTPFSLDGTLDEIFGRIVTIGTMDTIKVLSDIERGRPKTYKQIEAVATSYKRRLPEESELKRVDFSKKTAKELYDFIRALASPYPNAFIRCKDGKKLYFTGVHL